MSKPFKPRYWELCLLKALNHYVRNQQWHKAYRVAKRLYPDDGKFLAKLRLLDDTQRISQAIATIVKEYEP